MSEKFSTEKDGQIDFYNQFLPRINPNLTVEDIIANNNDGVLNGNLIEFKLSVKDLANPVKRKTDFPNINLQSIVAKHTLQTIRKAQLLS